MARFTSSLQEMLQTRGRRFKMLEEMGERLRAAGYGPDIRQVLMGIEDEEVKADQDQSGRHH